MLWYHTIVRPFFALDGEQEDAGVCMRERERERGRIHVVRSEGKEEGREK